MITKNYILIEDNSNEFKVITQKLSKANCISKYEEVLEKINKYRENNELHDIIELIKDGVLTKKVTAIILDISYSSNDEYNDKAGVTLLKDIRNLANERSIENAYRFAIIPIFCITRFAHMSAIRTELFIAGATNIFSKEDFQRWDYLSESIYALSENYYIVARCDYIEREEIKQMFEQITNKFENLENEKLEKMSKMIEMMLKLDVLNSDPNNTTSVLSSANEEDNQIITELFGGEEKFNQMMIELKNGKNTKNALGVLEKMIPPPLNSIFTFLKFKLQTNL